AGGCGGWLSGALRQQGPQVRGHRLAVEAEGPLDDDRAGVVDDVGGGGVGDLVGLARLVLLDLPLHAEGLGGGGEGRGVGRAQRQVPGEEVVEVAGQHLGGVPLGVDGGHRHRDPVGQVVRQVAERHGDVVHGGGADVGAARVAEV